MGKRLKWSNYLFSESLEQADEDYSNIELARPRTIKEISTPILKPKSYTNLFTRLEIRSSGAHSFCESNKKRRPRLVIREKYNREKSEEERQKEERDGAGEG